MLRRLLILPMPLMALMAMLLLRPEARAAEPAVQPPGSPRNLAAALLNAKPPTGTVALAVDAENTVLPQGSAIPGPGSSVESISEAFGRTVKPFGGVTAIAPPTMVAINPHPADGNPFFRLSRGVFRVLLASLDDACWRDLTSDRGLGVDDLPTSDQQKMFVAFIPAGSLRVGLPDSNISSQIELPTSAIVRGRLRLTQQVQIRLPSFPDGRYVGEYTQEKAGAPRQYYATSLSTLQDSSGALGGVSIQAAVPNAPKPGQLTFKDARFAVLIPLQGVHTVGELIQRIGQQTRTELYADHRLENLSLTVLGGSRTAPAADLLRAVAFCVTGTFRNVGPAFVLTDDLIGIATRQEIARRFNEKMMDDQRSAMQAANAHLDRLSQRLAHLPYTAGSPPVPPGEMRYAVKSPGAPAGALVTLHIPFAALSPEQQGLANLVYQKLKAGEDAQAAEPDYQEHPDQAAALPRVSLQGDLAVSSQLDLQLAIPGLDLPVDLGAYGSSPEIAAVIAGNYNTPPLPGAPSPPSASRSAAGPAAAPFLAPFHRRACLVAPQSLAELDSILAEMPPAGLNELWLNVPPPESSAGKALPSASAMVAEAISRAAAHGIAVLPVIDVLSWGPEAPAADTDYTVLGETSLQRHWMHEMSSDGTGLSWISDEQQPHLVVSPFAPGVPKAITALQREVLKQGIAGVVWRHIAPPGYDRIDGSFEEAQGDFGYHLLGRLQFLRQFHTDPVDIGLESEGNFNVSLPHFTEADSSRELSTEWRSFRQDADLRLLQDLYHSLDSAGISQDAAPAPSSALPVLLDLPGLFNMYAEWDDRRALPFVPEVRSQTALAAAVHKETRHALLPISHWALESSRNLVQSLTSETPLWNGVVFDLTPTPATRTAPARSSLEYLRRLVTMLQPQDVTGISPTGQPAAP